MFKIGNKVKIINENSDCFDMTGIVSEINVVNSVKLYLITFPGNTDIFEDCYENEIELVRKNQI